MRIDHLSRFPVMPPSTLTSSGCKSSHNGFLDVSCSNGGLRISGWIGQLSCLTIFSTSLSVAAFFLRAGGSMLESTGSHRRGVQRRVPEMRRSRDQQHQYITCRLDGMTQQIELMECFFVLVFNLFYYIWLYAFYLHLKMSYFLFAVLYV